MREDPGCGYSLREELVHKLTHGLGLVLSAAGGVVLIVRAATRGAIRGS